MFNDITSKKAINIENMIFVFDYKINMRHTKTNIKQAKSINILFAYYGCILCVCIKRESQNLFHLVFTSQIVDR